MRLISSLLASLVAVSGVAVADPSPVAATPDAPFAVGVRVGGYGFRRANDTSTNAWNECRMNGLGVFAQREVRGPLYLEAGLDAYSSVGPGEVTDLPIDRQSALVSIAAGAHTSFTPWLRGYVQLGAGVELARLSVPYGDSTIRDDKAMPEGFFGVGADLRIARGTFVGATLRTLVMGNFDYDPTRLQMTSPWVAAPSSTDVFSATPTLAEQAQFYLRRDL
jgi:hypothetical protein